MYYYFIIALQAYCVYHCYTKKNDYYWIFAILFLPLIGCLIYLFVNVIQKRDIDKVQQGLTAVINPTKKIKDLESRLKFSETFENQVALADAHLEAENFENAITNYKAALKDVFSEDFYVISKLQEAYYFSAKFEESIEYAKRIIDHTKFIKSKSEFLYALALEKNGEIVEAESRLIKFDAPYSRYQERLELAKFFIRNAKSKEARDLLCELVTESEGMSKPSYRQNRAIINKAKDILATGL